MNLTIDIGNTHVKTALFKGHAISLAKVHTSFNLAALKSITAKQDITHVILCSVKPYPAEWKNYLKKNFHFTELTEKTPLPIQNDYLSPASLGKDRLAGAVAANFIFRGKNVLSISAGTCITYDIVDNKGHYKGGAISPGLDMRFKAMHTFTGKLPLVSADTKYKGTVGRNTEESMRTGAQLGMIKEMEGMIQLYKNEYKNLQIVLSGGSMNWLKDTLQEKINMQPFLVLKGLNVILAAIYQNTAGNK